MNYKDVEDEEKLMLGEDEESRHVILDMLGLSEGWTVRVSPPCTG